MEAKEKYTIFNFESTPEVILSKLRQLNYNDVFFIANLFEDMLKCVETQIKELEPEEYSNPAELAAFYDVLMYTKSIVGSGLNLSGKVLLEMDTKRG